MIYPVFTITWQGAPTPNLVNQQVTSTTCHYDLFSDTSIRPFSVAIADFALKELKERLATAKLGEDLEDSVDFHYGFQV